MQFRGATSYLLAGVYLVLLTTNITHQVRSRQWVGGGTSMEYGVTWSGVSCPGPRLTVSSLLTRNVCAPFCILVSFFVFCVFDFSFVSFSIMVHFFSRFSQFLLFLYFGQTCTTPLCHWEVGNSYIRKWKRKPLATNMLRGVVQYCLILNFCILSKIDSFLPSYQPLCTSLTLCFAIFCLIWIYLYNMTHVYPMTKVKQI